MRCCAGLNAAVTTIEARAIVVIHHDGVVDIRIVNDGDVYIVHCSVVVEVAAVPTAAVIATAGVAEAVVNSAVEANSRSPIAGNKDIASVFPSPVARRPKESRIGSLHPSARHPIVVFSVPSPVAGSPDVIVAGTRRLCVYGKWWRGDSNGDADRDLSGRGNG